MKKELKQIYSDLSVGKLSQKEALDRIEALKLQPRDEKTGLLLATLLWRTKINETCTELCDGNRTEQHIVLCDSSRLRDAELKLFFPRARIASLDADENKNIGQRYTEYALECFERIQAILRSQPEGKVLMQVVVPDHEEETILAGLSGLLKTASLENPQFVGQVILVPREITTEELGWRLQQEKGGRVEPLVRYQQEVRQVLSWTELAEAPQQTEEAFRDAGVYLITGGLGALGVVFAKEILSRTRGSRVVLTGRKALHEVNEDKQTLLRSLAPDAERVSYRQVDLEDLDEVQKVMAAVQQEYGQLNGILHSAGMIADNFIVKKTGSEFKRVLGPKVMGTWNLDAATKDVELDFFVLFSSVASVMGNVGQADYASANGFMDQFAAYRNRLVADGQRHGRMRSINWPLWQDGGIRLDGASQELLQKTTGVRPMETSSGMSAFHRSLALPYDQILIVEGNVPQIRRIFPVRSEDQVRPHLAEQCAVPFPTDAIEADSHALFEKAQDYLCKQCSEVLKMPAHRIDPQAPLENYGIDSILAVKLTNHLEQALGPLSKTLFFEYQTIHELAKYFTRSHAARLATLLSASSNGKSHSPAQSLETRQEERSRNPTKLNLRKRFSNSAGSSSRRELDGIAIIGLSGRYPGARGIRTYWQNLRDGKDCIVEVPKERWDWREYFSEDRSKSGHHYSKWGGFITGVDEFDPLFFNISPKEAKYIDPQERLFLQHAWMALEDAGYTRAGLQVGSEKDLPGQVGVYVGLMYSEYQLFGAEASMRGERIGIPGSFASIANRVSYVLNAHGPSMTVDTMCSSSLTAIHLACEELKRGRIAMAIAGGVNVSIHPNKYLALSAGQFISSEGRCQSFGEGGDGYIPGEGVGVTVLKPLQQAEKDGDHIYGVIRGSALNHGGKTNGYTVPNPQAQASLIRGALAEAKTEARHISYLEAHGTGTKLGDPIEIAALNQAFQDETEEKQYCAIGSVKSNIGHLESAAGIAGLTKVLLQMQHGQLAPSLHAEQLNPHIDFANSAFEVNRELRAWERPVVDGRTLPRIAGISSFGAGGSNAHVIVEEYVGGDKGEERRKKKEEQEEVVIVLSARTREQLKEKARELVEYIGEEKAEGREIDLEAMAYTLQVGREGMTERLGIVVKTVEDLEEKLAGHVAGKAEVEGVYRGQGKRNHEEGMWLFSSDADLQETVRKWMENGKYGKLLELWVRGVEVEWGQMYGERKPRRMSLPTYPFARERYWIEAGVGSRKGEGAERRGEEAVAVLHPLVQRNTSDLKEQRYSTRLTGEEFFLAGQEVAGKGGEKQKALPAATYLEMARAAIEQACGERPEGAVLELRDVVWAEPFVVQQPGCEVNIALQAEEEKGIAYEIYSGTGDEEIVHCQGRGEWSSRGDVAKLDVEQLKREGGTRQIVAELHLGDGVERTATEYVLHPAMVGKALEAGMEMMQGEGKACCWKVEGVEKVRIVSGCGEKMLASIRESGGEGSGNGAVKLDIDLCDPAGQVCVEMRGVSWQVASVEREAEKEENKASVLAVERRREIVLRAGGEKKVGEKKVGGGTSKPRGVSLTELESGGAEQTGVVKREEGVRAGIQLREPAGAVEEGSSEGGESAVRLLDCGEGVYRIEMGERGKERKEVREAIEELLRALERVEEEKQLKVVMMVGMEEWLGGRREEYNAAVEQGLYRRLVSFPYPVIAVLKGDVKGAGLLGAAMCDLMVGNQESWYGNGERGFDGSAAEERVLSERFGRVQAEELLYVLGEVRGTELRRKGWTSLMVTGEEVEREAERLARRLAGKRQEGLRLLKQHLVRGLVKLVEELKVKKVEERREESGAGRVAVIELRGRDGEAGSQEGMRELREAFARVREEGSYGAVVLKGCEEEFLPVGISEEEMEELKGLIVGSEIPVVAAVRGNARGWSWIATQYCDARIYNRSGKYGTGGMSLSVEEAVLAGELLTYRLGEVLGREMVLTGAEYKGVELEELGLEVAEGEEVMARAEGVAKKWAEQSRSRVREWKKQSVEVIEERVRRIKDAVAGVRAGAQDREDREKEAREEKADFGVIALRSKVVRATAHGEGIVVVRMEDRQAKNMFSEELVMGLREAFARIEERAGNKVVVLTGYESYFASGGTKESLLAIQAGEARFTDNRIFEIAVKCKLPVIAAMQGHGIGAGWTLGLMADVVVMSEESRYVSPYMSYGFTPGAGATWVMGRKLGADVGRESLLSGEVYGGEELKRRGVKVRVLRRGEVEEAAMGLARRMVRRSGEQLRGLKQQWREQVDAELEETYRLEVGMHEQTFVGQGETLERIEKNFYSEEIEPAGVEEVEEKEGSVEAESRTGAGRMMDEEEEEGEALRGVTGSLRKLLAAELQMEEKEIDEDMEFVELGLDSIIGVTWIRKINERYETAIEATKVYSYPTLRQLSRYVKEEAEKRGTLAKVAKVAEAAKVAELKKRAAQAKPIAQKPTAPKEWRREKGSAGGKLRSWRTGGGRRSSSSSGVESKEAAVSETKARVSVGGKERIAVIGMAGQFPEARNVEEYWKNLAEGKNCIREVGGNRWDVSAYYEAGAAVAGKSNSRWAGEIEGYDRFDPLFFNISPTEAESMDPQQRLFLQTSWHAVEDAGYESRGLSGSKCGVFVGCATGDYHQLSRRHQLSAQGFTGSAMSILAARIAYFLNLQGPCWSIDTACSSSLVAMANACDSLNSRSSDIALAGGVYVMTGPELHIRTSQAGMLSAEGRCYTFDQRANGFVPGEGVGVVVLKRLTDAERDGDLIYGVIEGWGVNQDGKTNGITAPNPESQTRLEQEVYERYGIDPGSIQLIEAHGTATKLGDPVEVEGLKNAFRKYTEKKEYCALGSVKSNIGHCLAAAGVAGVIKVLLALKHRQLPPTINFERLNEHIELKDSPFYVNQQLQEWKLNGGKRRQAAVSSFGFSGTNAHVVLGEYEGAREGAVPAEVVKPQGKEVVVLSARTKEQLKQKAEDLLAWIEREPGVDLQAMAYTLQVGRTAMEQRVGLLVSSAEQLREKLKTYIRGESDGEDIYKGSAKDNKEALALFTMDQELLQQAVEKWMANKKFGKLLELWVKGLEVDWKKLYGEKPPRRLRLPLYPFAQERYWIDATENGPAGVGVITTGMLHPLLHRNTSDLSEQRYSSTFTGEEFFLADHRVRMESGTLEKVLPGVACLEMARAAIQLAWPAPSDSSVLELRNTVWLKPIILSAKRQLSIVLSPSDDEHTSYEIYEEDNGVEIVYCQGQALWTNDVTSIATVETQKLPAKLTDQTPSPASLYNSFMHAGLLYGPSFQPIVQVHRGDQQVCAELRLPINVGGTDSYVLHPSTMQGVLQAAAVGLPDSASESMQRELPHSLESLRIIAPCKREMIAWVRYPRDSRASSLTGKVDIDLCDESGRICVEMRGFTSRVWLPEIDVVSASSVGARVSIASPIWQASSIDVFVPAIEQEYKHHHFVICELPGINPEQLQRLVPRSNSTLLRTENHIGQRYTEYALECFERIQAILRSQPEGKVLMQVVVPDHEEQTILAGLSGLLKTASLENPQFVGQVILVPGEISTEELGRRLQQEKGGRLEPLVRYQQEVRQVLSWTELAEAPQQTEEAFRDAGVYLITGGLGALGVAFAKEILSRTRGSRVVLTGRKALHEVNEDKQALLRSLGEDGERVSYRQLDLEDLAEVKKVIAAVQQEYGQLNGILHSAGMIADNFIVKKTGSEFKRVLGPKVTGTWNLDTATKEMELEFFVLFSSGASVMGNVGQADYASANGFMDQFAAYRNRLVADGQRQGRTRSINWPLWQDGGMATDTGTRELLQQITGMQPIKTETGLQAFHQSITLPFDQILVLQGDTARLTKHLKNLSTPSSRATATTSPYPAAVHESNGASKLAPNAAVAPIKLTLLREGLKAIVAGVLGVRPEIIDSDRPFAEIGLDSFLAVQMMVAINKEYGTELSNAKLFDHPTINRFSVFLQKELEANRGDSGPEFTAQNTSAPVEVTEDFPVTKRDRRRDRRRKSSSLNQDEKIAIIGMSGRYAKANDLKQYWDNLVAGRNCIVEVPRQRFDVDRYYDPERAKQGKTNSKWLGAIDDIDCFDPLFFRISPQEAEYMDPQHRVFLQEAYRTFEDAGYSSSSLSSSRCGVYLGISTNEYSSLLLQSGIMSAPVTSNSYAIGAARIAYHLNLKGPAISVDTACSSSLVAIHLASQALLNREIDMALAGGVSLWLTPESSVIMGQAGMFSSQGQCRAFDDGADGIVNGEGVGAVLLKRLSDAQRDNDLIYGVIVGSGINQDGKTNGITAPSVSSQADLERSVYARHKIDPETISYIEAHGTGTKLGDPIELEALATVFKEKTSKKNFCALASVKSNIGHTASAAGVAAVHKVLLSLRHRTLVPTLNVRKENSNFDFANSPFYISRETKAWEATAGSLRRAGVSSFGFSGTNAHLVIEEYVPPARQIVAIRPNPTSIVPLSARTKEQLQQKARDLLKFIRAQQPSNVPFQGPATVELSALAYTLQIGREALEERLGFVVSSVDELSEKLTRYLNGEKNIDGMYQGRPNSDHDHVTAMVQDDDMLQAIERWITGQKFSTLLDWWTRGLNFDWNKLYPDVKPQRVSLPTYPFARERYWISSSCASRPADAGLEEEIDLKSIEDIITKLEDDVISPDQAVRELKILV